MLVELWPIDRPIKYGRNPRVISEEAVSKTASSIREFGFRVPIVVDEDDVILAGHVRLEAAKRLQLAEIPVHVAHGLTAAQRKAFRIAENRTHEEAHHDLALLGLELAEIREIAPDFDLAITAFEPNELAAFFAEDTSPPPEENQEPAAEKPMSHTVKFSGEQWEAVITGLYKLREIENAKDIDDARALELIVADWFSGQP